MQDKDGGDHDGVISGEFASEKRKNNSVVILAEEKGVSASSTANRFEQRISS